MDTYLQATFDLYELCKNLNLDFEKEACEQILTELKEDSRKVKDEFLVNESVEYNLLRA